MPAARRMPAAFELLPAKLAIPSLQPRQVPRVALVNRLRASSDARIVSVSAPAGYGKTTLLAQWAAADPRPFAWLSLDRRDNDPASLLTYVAAALDTIQPLGPKVFRAVAVATRSIWTSAVPRLGAVLASMPEPIVLVLDNIDALTNQDGLDALEALGQHMPRGSRLALSGRSDSGLPLARLRARGCLLEVRSAEIALNDTEALELLSALGAAVSAQEAATLNARAEGWAAGLYLAALLVLESGTNEALATFGGDDRFVVDYLRAEHLSRLKPADVTFLRRTSVLERLSAPLCDEVLGRTDSARRLESLERGDAFIVALDHRLEWYRSHHLFRDMLRSELEHREPGLVAALNGRAAAWCEANGLPDEAIEHAYAGGDLAGAARLFARHVLPVYRSGRVLTVERWLSWFDEPEVLQQHPAVAAFGAAIHAFHGRAEAAKRSAYALETTTYEGSMPDGSDSVGSWARFVRALLCEHGIDEMRADAALALDGLSPSSYWRPTALALLGAGALFGGDKDEAAAAFAVSAEAAAATGDLFAGIVSRSELALLALDRSDLEAARAEIEHAHRLIGSYPVAEYMANAILLAVQARVELERGQNASARTVLLSALRLRPQLASAMPWFAIHAQLELAKAHLAIADVRGARALLRESEDLIRQRPDQGTLTQQVDQLRDQLATTTGLEEGWASTLTAAELRLLPLLTTHLSFRELAERLYVSRNTVKTQAISIYRKLGASSRSEAIDRAVDLGLVDAPLASGTDSFIRTG